MSVLVQRYAAFSDTPEGGNPAGVVLDAFGLSDAEMQRIATEVGDSETAFLTTPVTPGTPIRTRYFAPEAEVDFCGHATLATAVALGSRHGWGRYELTTNAGLVLITAHDDGRRAVGAFESPPVSCRPLDEGGLLALLDCLGWSAADLHPDFPPAIGHAGNDHPVLVCRTLARLRELAYDFPALQSLCRGRNWITVQLAFPVAPGHWRSRNPFPWGGVVEDPATGAAAAALLGYLRALGRLDEGATLAIDQGVEMGRPSRITATLTGDRARISGTATRIPSG